MQFKLALLALVSSASAAALPQFDETAEIVGGELARAGDFPFIVSLQRSSGSHFCGGTLVNANTVITAGHCSVGQTASAVSVRAGSLKRGSGGTVVKVSRIIVHPSYNTGVALNYDVAIWKLATAIPTSSTISYATLAASGSDPASGSSSTVAGWGTTSSGGSSPVDLRKVTVPIVARTTCKSQYDASPDYTADDISVNMVCAGYTAGGKDSCQGDSGGPLVNSAKTLIGIVSWGEGCAAPGFPGVYARVGTLRSFIDANL